jgi:peptidoglycan/LPS O-acetylase OafA/YrhL
MSGFPGPLKYFSATVIWAVAMFFLLSGFILAYTYEGQIAGIKNRVRF